VIFPFVSFKGEACLGAEAPTGFLNSSNRLAVTAGKCMPPYALVLMEKWEKSFPFVRNSGKVTVADFGS
jgi:hypothetical protein